MLDVLANANRRNKHSTPDLSTMNISRRSFSRQRSIFSRRTCLGFSNEILFTFHDFFACKMIMRSKICTSCIFLQSTFVLSLLLLYFTAARSRYWRSEHVGLGHSDNAARYTPKYPLLITHITMSLCVSHVRARVRHSIRFALPRDDLVLHGILHAAPISLRAKICERYN